MRTSVPSPRARSPPRPLPSAALLVGLLLFGSVALPLWSGVGGASAQSAAITLAPSTEGWYHLTVHGSSPTARDSSAFVWDTHDGYALLFGGCRPHACPLGETWKYQGGAWANLTSSLSIAPAPRTSAAAAYDPVDGTVVLFGGSNGAAPLNDTWTFAGGVWSPRAVGPMVPPARSGASLTWDYATSSLILFGGSGPSGLPLADTWSYAGGVWTNLTSSLSSAPTARTAFAMSYDSADAVVVLYGGLGASGGLLNDTWTFDGARWWNVTAGAGVSPGARSGAAFTYDSGRGLLVLYGGSNGQILGDTWSFTHGAWGFLVGNTTTSPGTRVNAVEAFDPSDGYLLLFGGHTPLSSKVGTWLYLDLLSATLSATARSTVPGVADTFSVAPTGGLGPYNISWNFGDGSAAQTGPTAGHTYFSPGSYAVTVTVTDALAYTASGAVTVAVALPPLAVTLAVSPSQPNVGQTVTATATVTGGASPYSYAWSGDTSGCTSTAANTLTCLETKAGSFTITVTVADSAGHSTAASSALTVAAQAGGLASSAPTPGPSASGLSASFTTLYATAAILVACLVGVVTYRAGRRREAARREALRPLCYAVPAWSETPAEFETETYPPPSA